MFFYFFIFLKVGYFTLFSQRSQSEPHQISPPASLEGLPPEAAQRATRRAQVPQSASSSTNTHPTAQHKITTYILRHPPQGCGGAPSAQEPPARAQLQAQTPPCSSDAMHILNTHTHTHDLPRQTPTGPHSTTSSRKASLIPGTAVLR